MLWYLINLILTLFWDFIRLSRLSPDEKTLEILVLRQQLLIVRRHQKRGPTITCGEKLMLLTLVEQLGSIRKAGKARLEQLILIFSPTTLLGWHQTLVKRKWTFGNTPKRTGRPDLNPETVALILRLARENRGGIAESKES